MWKYSILVLAIFASCNNRVTDRSSAIVIDSITYHHHTEYTCGVSDKAIRFYISSDKAFSTDSVYIAAGDYTVKFGIDTTRSINDKRKFCLARENDLFGSLQEMSDFYNVITKYERGTITTLNETAIDSFIKAPTFVNSYYLDYRKVSPTDSIAMNKHLPLPKIIEVSNKK
jgi:hypothetical protein